MRKSIIILSIVIVLLTVNLSSSVSRLSTAATPTVQPGDLVGYSYRLVANGSLVEVKTEDDPEKRRLAPDISPPGLFDELLGMKLGGIKDAVIPPEKGFAITDFEYGHLFNLTLYFNDLKVVILNNIHYTDINTGFNPGTFGYYFIRIGGGILGAAVVVFLVYGGYKIYPKVLGKKCVACKKIAIGTCKKCGRTFCENCYSNGCPFCKSRTLLRFKT